MTVHWSRNRSICRATTTIHCFSNEILLSRTVRFPTTERCHSFTKQVVAASLQFTFSKMTFCKGDTTIKFNRFTKQKSLCGKQLTGTTEIKTHKTSLLRMLCFQKVLECHNGSSNISTHITAFEKNTQLFTKQVSH